MRRMTPEDFFESMVREDYEDWKEQPSSVRRAFHLSVSAFHMAENYFRYHCRHSPPFANAYPKDDDLEKFQRALIARTPGFKVIQDVANTFKHLYPRARCEIGSSGSISDVSYNGTKIEDHGKDIFIRRRDGKELRFSHAAVPVVEMWESIIGADQVWIK